MSADFRLYEKTCPVQGSRKLIVARHFGVVAMIPEKCRGCANQEEMECILFRDDSFKMLDYGPCDVEGPVHLVELEGLEHPVPAKCVGCPLFIVPSMIPDTAMCRRGVVPPDYYDTTKRSYPSPGIGLDYGGEQPCPSVEEML